MDRLLRVAFCVWVLVLVWGPANSGAGDLPSRRAQWKTLQVEDLTVLTDGETRRAVQLAEELLALRVTLEQLSTGMVGGRVTDTRFFVFKGARSFEPYLPLYKGEKRELAGYFVRSPVGDVVTIGSLKDDHGRTTIFHEYVHSWLDANFPRAPLWFHEGIATYYAMFELDDEVALVGRPHEYYVQLLRHEGAMDLEQLFEVDHESEDYNEDGRVGKFYATSWALVRLLLLEDGYRVQLVPFLMALSNGDDPVESAESLLHVRLETLAYELERSVDSATSRYYRVPIDLPQVDESLQRPIPYAELLEQLGDLALAVHRTQSDLAARHYQAALQERPRSVKARVGMGWLAILDEKPREALRWAAEALEASPGNPTALSFAALAEENALDWDAEMGDMPTTLSPAELLRAREYAQQSLDRRPGDVKTMGYLGRSWLLERDNAEGVAWMRRALSLEPQSLIYTSDLCILLANADSLDAARFELRRGRLLPRGEERLDDATRVVVEAAARRALELAEFHHFAQARTQIELSRHLTRAKDLTKALDDALATIVEQEAAHQESLRVEGLARRFNAALDAAKEGRLVEARDAARALLDQKLPEDLRAQTARFLQAVEKAIEGN